MRRTKSHYAHATRQKLSQRHKATDEVKEVLTGGGFKKVKPRYESRPDTRKVEVQHQVLCHEVDHEFYGRLYGKKQDLRHLDPEMSVILAWGECDPPVKNDFTTSKGAFTEKYKINKMGVEFISEKQDNYRDHVNDMQRPKADRIVEYMQGENQNLIRKKIYKNLLEKDEMAHFTTEYRVQSAKNDEALSKSLQLHDFYENVTVAGQARYMAAPKLPGGIVAPGELKSQVIEDKIKDAWRTAHLDPQLEREEEEEVEDDRQLIQQQTALSQQTSANKKAMIAEQERIAAQQRLELNDEQRKELDDKMKELKKCSRWLPDSALTTYFGKPAFHAYGNGNTEPTYGGSVYGQFLLTHNINPHAGGNKPEFNQVHGRAMLGGTVQIRGPGSRSPKKAPVKFTRKPVPPRIAPPREFKKQVTQKEQDEAYLKRFPITSQTFREAQARQCLILPPTFTEKHLKTKQAPEDRKGLMIGRAKSDKKAKSSKHGASTFDMHRIRAGAEDQSAKETAKQSPSISDRQTVDSQRHGTGEPSPQSGQGRSEEPSAVVSGHDQSRRLKDSKLTAKDASQMPFCDAHGGQEATANEFLHLLDPKNYKFLPHKFTNNIRYAGKVTVNSENVKDLLNLEPSTHN